ncbi:MAG: acyl-CoA dehydrogenase family protein, partial [Conexivisphaerales archaeon]
PLIEFSQEEELFRESVQDFASKNISPVWEAMDQASSERAVVHKDMISKLGQQGLLALMCSPKHGGQGATETMATIAIEELAYADPSVATAVYTLLNIGWP